MTHLKRLTSKLLILSLCALALVSTHPSNAQAATTTDCSDVFTGLSSYVVDGVNANKTFYLQAMNETGVPWELLAAIHYRETNFSHTNPSNGQGIFQFVGESYPPGPVSDTEFYRQLKYMAGRIQNDYALRNSPNGASVSPRALTPNEQDITLIKNTLYSYNGRASVYANQATSLGYNASTQPYEGSPYVMNRFDCPRARMGIITQDYGDMDGTDTRYGAFTIFARLRGDSYWLSMTKSFSWIVDSQGIYYDVERTKPTNTALLAPNTTYYLRLGARNIGSSPWSNTGSYPTNLGTSHPNDRQSPFYDSSWLGATRPGTFTGTQNVLPGQIATYDFKIRTPSTYGTYTEHFNVVIDGLTWLDDPGPYWTLTVGPPTNHWQLTSKGAYTNAGRNIPFSGDQITLSPGGTAYTSIGALNNGSTTWSNSILHLGTTQPRDRQSIFSNATWTNAGRINMNEVSVSPGDQANFIFSFTAPNQPGVYRECLNLVADGQAWLNDLGVCYNIQVAIKQTVDKSSSNSLAPGAKLTRGQYLMSNDGSTTLRLTASGALELRSNGTLKWSNSAKTNSADSYVVMQTDGNLVEYASPGGATLWNTSTTNANSTLVVQQDGNLVVYGSGGQAQWNSGTHNTPDYYSIAFDQFGNGEIYPWQSMTTPDRVYHLEMQGDGNLVLYKNNAAIWDTGTNGRSISSVSAQGDGNIVMYDTAGRAVWSTRTFGNTGARLVLQQDGNLVVYSSGGQALWSSRTASNLLGR